MSSIKKIIKFLLSKVTSLRFLERLTQNLIWRDILLEKKPEIIADINGKVSSHEKWNELLRTNVWNKIANYIKTDKDILYLEFGVWKGDSIKYFAEKFKSENSEFYGFDTFHGMPNEWRHMEQGHYSTSGNVPKTDDNRIKFIGGLFQETLPDFLNKLNLESKKKLVVIHFDAVLYSSTLFTLFKLYEHIKNYYFIFDQLGTDECRAFINFNESKLKKYELYFASKYNGAPEVVFGKFIKTKI